MWNTVVIIALPAVLFGFVMGYMISEIYKAIHFRFETDMGTIRRYDPEDPYSCTCGNRHPLVERFGKCGKCMDEIYGRDPNVN